MTSLRQKKETRVLLWQIFNALVVFVSTYLSGLEWDNAIFVSLVALPFVNAMTKYINTTYFGDIGVERIEE